MCRACSVNAWVLCASKLHDAFEHTDEIMGAVSLGLVGLVGHESLIGWVSLDWRAYLGVGEISSDLYRYHGVTF